MHCKLPLFIVPFKCPQLNVIGDDFEVELAFTSQRKVTRRNSAVFVQKFSE